MAKYLTEDTDLTSVANAIRAKGGTQALLEFPTGFVSAINDITTGGAAPALEEKDVNFIDYDGTLLYSYTKTEVNAMTQESDLPANPTHTGLTSQGWNWTLAQIKAQLTAIPNMPVWVGQMYVTTSGKSEIDVVFDDANNLSPWLSVAVNGTIEIDWGDGSATESLTGSSLTASKYANHTYALTGNYTIKLNATTGTYSFFGSGSTYDGVLRSKNDNTQGRIYSSKIVAVRIGTDAGISDYAFRSCYSMQTITIPSTISSTGTNLFSDCFSLKCLVFPIDITEARTTTFNRCLELSTVSLPGGLTTLGSTLFQYCYHLKNITIPSGVSIISNSSFAYCYGITKISMSNDVTQIQNSAFSSAFYLSDITLPSDLTSIGNSSFTNCYSLRSIVIPNKVTSIGSSCFTSCYSLESVTLSNKLTTIGSSAFNSCYTLREITIPDTVTSIGNSAFGSCYAIRSITIPSSVTSIGTSCFSSCYSMQEYHFKSTTPPTITSTNVFQYSPSSAIMYVPYSADHSVLNAYKTANYWSTYASQMQEEPAPAAS